MRLVFFVLRLKKNKKKTKQQKKPERPTLAVRKNHHFYTLSTFYTKLKSHTNRKSDTICSFAPHNVCQSLPKPKKTKKHTPTPQIFSIPWVCFFCFFWFSRGFCYFWWKASRKPKKTKKTKKHTPTPQIFSIPWVCFFCFFLFFLVFSRFLPLLVESLKKTKKYMYYII